MNIENFRRGHELRKQEREKKYTEFRDEIKTQIEAIPHPVLGLDRYDLVGRANQERKERGEKPFRVKPHWKVRVLVELEESGVAGSFTSGGWGRKRTIYYAKQSKS